MATETEEGRGNLCSYLCSELVGISSQDSRIAEKGCTQVACAIYLTMLIWRLVFELFFTAVIEVSE